MRSVVLVVLGNPIFDSDASATDFGYATNREPRGVTSGAFVRRGSVGLFNGLLVARERFEDAAWVPMLGAGSEVCRRIFLLAG